MKKVLVSGLFTTALILSPILAGAQTATSTSVNSMLQQIQALQAQIKAMQDAQKQLLAAQTNIQTTLGLIRNLNQGMSGDDVKALQAILASDPTIFNGQITGFFGPLTAQAVKKFQKKNGLDQVGNVGPKTLKKLNEEFRKLGLSFELSSSTATSTPWRKDDDKGERGRPILCVKVPQGQQIPQGWVRHDDDDDDDRGEKGERENKKGKMILIPCQALPPQSGQGTTTPTTGTTTPVALPTFTMAQVATHSTQNDCHSVVSGSVYNLTSWIAQHPGGASAIIGMCGKDGTASFMSQHGGQNNPVNRLAAFKIGTLVQ
jgi:peptidoglycan hydrolase-like protein with peptidoglycan-binding domain